jgi:hypothetical protein
MDDELQRRFNALEAADQAWREHRLSGWDCWSRSYWHVSRQVRGASAAWRTQEELLKERFEAARAEWLSYLVARNT